MFRLKQKVMKQSRMGLLTRSFVSVLVALSLSPAVALACPAGESYSTPDKTCVPDSSGPTTNGCGPGYIYSLQDKRCVPDSVSPTPAPSNGSSSEDQAVKCTGGRCDLVKKYITPTITVLAAIFGTVAAISIILGGINFTTSEGDPQKAARAKSRITNTIIATVAFLFLYAFLQFLIPGGIFNR